MRTTARIRMMVAKRMGRLMATGEGILVDRKMCVCAFWGDEEGDVWMLGGHLRGRGRGTTYSHCCSCCGGKEALHYHVNHSSKGDENGDIVLEHGRWAAMLGFGCEWPR